jgi:serine protease
MTLIERNVRAGVGVGLVLAVAACQTQVTGRSLEEDDTGAVERFRRTENRIPGRYIVVLEQDQTQRGVVNPVKDRADVLASSYRAVVAAELEGALNGFVAEMDEEDAIALSGDPAVAFVEEDGLVFASETQTGAPFGLDRIDQVNLPLDGNYNFDRDGTGVHVYIIDTGIRATHVALGGRIGDGFDAIGDGFGTDDCQGHGTHVSGTVGSDLFGVAKNVTLHPVRVLGCDGSGSNSGVIAGVNFVAQSAELPAVANMSLGGGASDALDQAVQNAIASGVTFAVAAGNESTDACVGSPSRVGEALTVASSERNDSRSGFSNFGSCVDLFAPGSGILSLSNASDTATAVLSGTSMATPHVAGTAALFLQDNPGATPAEVEAALLGGTVTGLISDTRGSPNRLLNTAFASGGAPDPDPDPDPDPGEGTPQSGSATGSVAQGQRVDFQPLPVLAGTTIDVQLSGSGDPDLYVSINQPAALVNAPTQTTHLCAPFIDGAGERCTFTVPSDGTQAFITVHGFSASDFRIDASWVEP